MDLNNRTIEFAATGTASELVVAMGSLVADVFRERLERAKENRLGDLAHDQVDEDLDIT